MPRTAPDAEFASIATWFKSIGDRIERGDSLAEVQTDKVMLEIEASASGVLAEVVHEAGVEVRVGEPIAYLEVDE
ncbi:MAG TPA: lipoyl domain-containing protein [Acidimicrobiales bacterium]|nr:lipoyl domain-containing protein [Acidimicrobiales bacterium]